MINIQSVCALAQHRWPGGLLAKLLSAPLATRVPEPDDRGLASSTRGACPEGPSAAQVPGVGARRSWRPEPRVGRALLEGGPSIDPARAVAERSAAAGVLWHPLGTSAHGAVGLQSAVPLV